MSVAAASTPKIPRRSDVVGAVQVFLPPLRHDVADAPMGNASDLSLALDPAPKKYSRPGQAQDNNGSKDDRGFHDLTILAGRGEFEARPGGSL